MYKRKLKHSRVKNLHKFASQKNKSTCLVESSLEFDACFHFEFIAKQDGRDLILVTDKQIRVYPTLNNLKLLHRYSGFQSLTELQTCVLELVKQYSSIKVGQLASYLKVTAGELLATVLRLLSLGKLFADLTSSEISIETAIWSNNV